MADPKHDKRRDEEQRDIRNMRPPDYIERTKPEDPSGREGQLTRDNVTPAIPSAPQRQRGAESINEPAPYNQPVRIGNDAQSLVLPPAEPHDKPVGSATERGYDARNPNNPDTQGEKEKAAGKGADTPPADQTPVSINEPPGSQVVPPPSNQPQASPPGAGPQHPYPGPHGHDDDDDGDDPLPSHAELERMTRAELDELAEQRGVDVAGASNKQDVIDELRKDARKRKRGK